MALCLQPLKKYAEFGGRASRLEYWSFYLVHTLVAIVVAGVGMLGVFAGMRDAHGLPAGTLLAVVSGIVLVAFCLGTLVPVAAVSIRRLHDRGLSAWFALSGLVPGIGGLVLLVLFCLPGEVGDNAYGPDPKASGE